MINKKELDEYFKMLEENYRLSAKPYSNNRKISFSEIKESILKIISKQ